MSSKRWLNRTVWGIVLATFLSDVSHEMCTSVLPDFLKSVGLGAMSLGLIEGLADFLGSLSRLGGGIVGHRVRHKKPWTVLGYVITTIFTAAIGLARSLPVVVTLRTIAWSGRGFRSPLRDYMLADAVEKTHYGRAFGLERAGDMLGAVVGPLIAAALVAFHVDFSTVILFGFIPGMLSASAMLFLARERVDDTEASGEAKPQAEAVAAGLDPLATPESSRRKFSPIFWWLLVGVMLFGMGDFSRTFLVLLAASAVRGASAADAASSVVPFVVALPMLLYAMHNAVSAVAAYPAGHLGDRRAKLPVLVAGYAIGVGTNVLLAFGSGSIAWLAVAFVLSGTYIAVEETLEKAVMAELLPRELRSLGLGILAAANALGDMASSLYVGILLEAGKPQLAFSIAAVFGTVGVAWMLLVQVNRQRHAG